MFENTLETVYNIDSEYVRSINNLINSGIKKYVQILGTHFGYSMEDIAKHNMYIKCGSCSFASDTLKQQYLDTKDEYLKMLDELYEIVKQSPQLSVCYNNAGGMTTVGEKNSEIHVNLRQVINCAGDMITNDIEEGNITLDQLAKEIKVMKNSILSKDDILNMIDSKLNERMNELSSKIQASTGIIIVLIILFIFSMISIVLSIYNMRSVNRKLKGKYIDKYDMNRIMTYLK
jgi:hypothetical protein